MKQIGTYGRVRIAFIVIGIAVMSAIGGATFVHTHDETATAVALVACAAGLALFGRRVAAWWWGEVMLGLDDPYGEPTKQYESTTRSRTLAPKIVRMIERAEAPVTVIATGMDAPPEDGTPDAWSEAVQIAAKAGATVRLLLPPGTSDDEAGAAEALADAHPSCAVFKIADTRHGALQVCWPTIAWEGTITSPTQAMFWLEAARDAGETETSAEFHNTRNLRRNAWMLEEFLRSLERAAMRQLTMEHAKTTTG